MENQGRSPRSDLLGILVTGFLTTVLVSTVAYFGRLPVVMLPDGLLLGLILGVKLLGGFVIGRAAANWWRSGALAGLLSALLDSIMLGSLIGDGSVPMPEHAPWVAAGFFVLCLGVGILGAGIGRRLPIHADPSAWRAGFAKTAAGAVFVLVLMGGVVTSADAGLAVPDWPTSFEANMFLFPLSKMVGGVFYEHAHRLFGALIGLTTLALGICLLAQDRRRWVKSLAVLAMVMVIGQGIMGGVRVTMANASEGTETFASLNFAVVHGVTGQLFLCLMVVLAVVTSRSWRTLSDRAHETAPKDMRMNLILVGLLVVQLTLGALLRHHGRDPWLIWHILGAFLLIGHALVCAARAQSNYRDIPVVRRTGLALSMLPVAQLALGFVALLATNEDAAGAPWALVVATSHQVLGALVLATGFVLLFWSIRLMVPGSTPAVERSLATADLR